MAVTFRGSIATNYLIGDGVNRNVLVLANTFRSRSTISILRLVAQVDPVLSATGSTANRLMPILRARRCAANSVLGGIEIAMRGAFDTNINAPDPGVKVYCDPMMATPPGGNLAVTPENGNIWQQFTARSASDVEQRTTFDNSIIARLSAVSPITLRVGEALVVEWINAAAPVGGVVFIQMMWEEDQTDTGYVVGGTVNLSGSPVTGAKVILVTDSTTAMPSPRVETLTTGAPGTFSKTLASGVKSAVFVQHEVGETKYSDEGKPFIEQ